MTAELIAMIILNAYLVAALLTVTKMYFSKKRELKEVNIRYREKDKDWWNGLQEQIELHSRVELLKKENKELKNEQIQSNH